MATISLNEHIFPDLSKICISYVKTPFDNVIYEIDSLHYDASAFLSDVRLDLPLCDIMSMEFPLLIPQLVASTWFAFLTAACKTKSQERVNHQIFVLRRILSEILGDHEDAFEIFYETGELMDDGTWTLPNITLMRNVEDEDDNEIIENQMLV